MDSSRVMTRQITVIMNGDLDKTCEVVVHNNKSLNELVSDCKEMLRIPRHVKCKLFDSTGGELSDDDIEYMNPEEPLFISQGEDFIKSSSLAIYQQIRTLGEGGFGSVYLYEHKLTAKQFAIKFIDISTIVSPEDVSRAYSEIATLRNLKHPNIVNLADAFDANNKICFVMEYCSGGELTEYIEKSFPLPEEEIYSLACQIAEAIRFCHNSKVIHRDLKMENILFSDQEKKFIKIVDFGIAGMFAVGTAGERSDAGSLLYIAPEVLSGTDNRANPALDVWSMGCIFYALLMKNLPFNGKTQDEIVRKILRNEYPPLSATISRPWHRLIKGMLRVNPLKRWNMVKITEHLFRYKYEPQATLSSESEEFEEKKAEKKKIDLGKLQTNNSKSPVKAENKNTKSVGKGGKTPNSAKSPTKPAGFDKRHVRAGSEKK